MTISVSALEPPTLSGVLPELFRRQAVLASLGVLFLAALVPTLAAAASDPRMLEGAEVWTKPAKFLLSLSVYSFTSAWFFGYVDADHRRGRVARSIVLAIVITSVFEIAYILIQASRGERSHFNVGDPFHFAMYGLMGLGALVLAGASPLLAGLIVRWPRAGLRPAYRDAVVLGLVLTFVLGAGLGGAMSVRLSHWVGPAPGGPGLPLFGWSTTGGDLRPPHFFGIHAEQALPLFALLLPGCSFASRLAVWTAAGGYTAFTLWVFARALAGFPLIPA